MYKVTVRVVETMADKRATPKYRGKSLSEIATIVAKEVASITGGVTLGAQTVGLWVDADGQPVTELGVDIITFAPKEQLNALRLIAAQLQAETGQDCVLYTVSKMDEVSFI